MTNILKDEQADARCALREAEERTLRSIMEKVADGLEIHTGQEIPPARREQAILPILSKTLS